MPRAPLTVSGRLVLVLTLGWIAGCRSSNGGAAAPAGGFSDDFESYAPDQPPGSPWTTQISSGATVVVDGTKARAGTKSIKVTTPSGARTKTAYIRLAANTVFPVTGNAFYGRMMFWLDAAPMASSPSVHWTFIQAGGLVPGQSYHALYRYGGQQPITLGNQLMANYETPDSYSGNGPGSDCYLHAAGVVVPVGRWACAEWQFDGANNTMRFWLDGDAVLGLTVTGTGAGCVNQPASYPWTAPTFDRLDLGWESYQTDDARTLWIDDVAVATTRIGCL